MSRLASISRRLWFGVNPEARKSRFHTEKGQYALGSVKMLADCAAADYAEHPGVRVELRYVHALV